MRVIHIYLGFFCTIVAITLIANTPARGQEDEKAKKLRIAKTKELLAKAEDEYRLFRPPQKTMEYWAAIKFEMELGKFDLAALHMKRMLGNDPDIKTDPAVEIDKDLVKIEEAEGMSMFLRFRQVRQWSDYEPFHKEAVGTVDKLIDRVTQAVEKHLSNRDRIRKYINRLDAPTPEERAYAFVQVARSRERAIPDLIETLRAPKRPSLPPRVRETLLLMGSETVPVYLEVFKAVSDKDYKEKELRLTLLDIVKKRDDKRVIPYLWHMHASKNYDDDVRRRAKEVLASLLRIPIEDVPPAKETLTYMAEKYYQHKMPTAEGKSVKLWEWTGEAIVPEVVELHPSRAEEFFGLRYAREALDLDPGYQPAQIVLMNITLDRYYRPKVDQILLEPLPPKMHTLLTTLDADLMIRVLERALEERQFAIALPLITALGERGEIRAAHFTPGGQSRGVVQGLYYPDRRVQFASMRAMLRMPPTTRPAPLSDRIVELNRRFLASSTATKALIVHLPMGDELKAKDVVKAFGFEGVSARSIGAALDLGKATADYEFVVLHRGMRDDDFPYVYAQLRNHPDLGGLPMLVIAEKSREKALRKLTASNPNAIVISEDWFQADAKIPPTDDVLRRVKIKADDPVPLKEIVEAHVKNVVGFKLTATERTKFAEYAMDAFWRMGTGEIQGYDVTPALDLIVLQLKTEDNAGRALEILGKLPGKDIQNRLARIVGDLKEKQKLRDAALAQLNPHIQKHGLLIGKNFQSDLRDAHKAAAEGSVFRAQLNVTVSLLPRIPSSAKTGADLLKFKADAPPPKDK